MRIFLLRYLVAMENGLRRCNRAALRILNNRDTFSITIPCNYEKRNGDANSIMAYKQKEEESIRAYYDRFTSATLNVPGHKEFFVTSAFTQGLLLGPLAKKIQGAVP